MHLNNDLHDNGIGVRSGWPPKIPKPPGVPGDKNPWTDKYPLSVTCFEVVRAHYVKMVIFVYPYTTTTTVPPSTSTTTSTQTISSTSTIIPDEVTVVESFSTTTTTTTTFTSHVIDISTATELVNATLTTTSYAACGTDNLLGPWLNKDTKVGAGSYNDYIAGR
ncbi:MAG: hypothetical protein Q9183_005066 [Haloplaca sp. 2 TL-2023]